MDAAGLRAESLTRVQAAIAAARTQTAAHRQADRHKRARRTAGLEARHARKLARTTRETP
ncbi:hypothetical protein CcI49_17115 [Frankia sp. CcI49]|uniref:hypothetical protein n=1 Tax=Frankia sp. CcI49 TaxID=1745382 RepID=UPI000977966A|nr:hypothetical protein [Frankia sp. CcI49]ONH59661.1 hypothetical protein CcI49_17115 [Frankia sp. CcI49]